MSIKHVVLFKLRDRTTDNVARAVAAIESLRIGVEQVESLEVGVDFAGSRFSFDLAATVTFADRAALDAYSSHPRHREVLAVMRELSQDFAIVDFDTGRPARGVDS